MFLSLGLDKCEWLEDIKGEDSLSASFTSYVEECIGKKESRMLEEGLNTFKLATYNIWQECRIQYLHGVSDAGTSPLFKFRTETHLNDELCILGILRSCAFHLRTYLHCVHTLLVILSVSWDTWNPPRFSFQLSTPSTHTVGYTKCPGMLGILPSCPFHLRTYHPQHTVGYTY